MIFSTMLLSEEDLNQLTKNTELSKQPMQLILSSEERMIFLRRGRRIFEFDNVTLYEIYSSIMRNLTDGEYL